jgi:hypothetical protein
MYRCLGEEFGDGRRWRLHYVNAREMANIVRAGEDGEAGDAGRFRDYEIPPFLTRDLRAGSTYRARVFEPAATDAAGFRLDLRRLRPQEAAEFAFRRGPLRGLRGAFAALRAEPGSGGGSAGSPANPGAPATLNLEIEGIERPLDVFLLPGFGLSAPEGELEPAGEEILDGSVCRRYLLAPTRALRLALHPAEIGP